MKAPILYLVAEDPARVASAAGEGATAVQLIHQYLGQDVLEPATARPATEPVPR